MDQASLFTVHRYRLRNLARGVDVSLRAALGAITGLVILLGLDGVESYPLFGASLIASGVVSYALFDPLTTRMTGHIGSEESPAAISGIRRLHLLVRFMCIAALAVAAHELFVQGIERMESTPTSFSFQDVVHFGPFVVPILLGIFLILATITLSWMLGDVFSNGPRMAAVPLLGACSAALASSVYFMLRASSPTNIFAILKWPDDATASLIGAHVALSAMLGMAGGSAMANVRSAPRRFVLLARALAVVTLAWCTAVYLAFDFMYEGLLAWKVFRCHAVVVSGWIVGLYAGPLGRGDSAQTCG